MDNIHKINGKYYKIIILDNKIKEVYKIENNTEVLCSKEDIQEIIDLLNQKVTEKIDEQEVNQIYLESIIEKIKDEVDKKNIKNYDDIKNYLNELKINPEQQEEVIKGVNDYFKEMLHSDKTTELEEYYNKTVDFLKKERQDSQHIKIIFEISSGILKQRIEIVDEKEQKTTTVLEKSFDYSIETRSHLITPIIGTMVSNNETIANEIEPIDMFTANYSIKTKNNISLSIKGCERTYADDLYKNVNETKTLNSEAIKAQEDVTNSYQNSSPEMQINQDLQDYGSLSQDEQQALIEEKGMVRKRTLNNNAAHINFVVLFLLIMLGIALLVYITLIILK